MDENNFPDYLAIRKRLRKKKGLGLYNNDDLRYLENPLGAASYTHHDPEPSKLKHWSDRVKCKVCGTVYTRSSSSRHKKTRHHRDYLNMNEKIRDLMLKK